MKVRCHDHSHRKLTAISPTCFFISIAEKALQLTLRAIELFEQESKAKIAESESTEDEAEKPFLPSGAKMYYLAGGILVQMKRYHAAIPYLEKAASSCKKWDGLEISIRQMLVVCFRHHMPPPPGDIPNDIADSTMLITLFQSGLSLSEIRPVLDSYRKARGSDSLKWNVECTDDSDMSLPFLFSVTFPASYTCHSWGHDHCRCHYHVKFGISGVY